MKTLALALLAAAALGLNAPAQAKARRANTATTVPSPFQNGAPAPAPVIQPAAPKSPSVAPGDRTCHTGLRGGTYTITASGRKNYAGC